MTEEYAALVPLRSQWADGAEGGTRTRRRLGKCIPTRAV